MCTANCGTPSATWAPAPGANNQTGYTTGALTNNTYFRRTVSADGVDPLVTEVLVTVTAGVAAARDFYYEFPPIVCAETLSETVAYYYPEIPTPANWLDRVGYVRFGSLTWVEVRLIDETGADGIAKARVVLSIDKIPAEWVRVAAYPTRVDLYTETSLIHTGTALTSLRICN